MARSENEFGIYSSEVNSCVYLYLREIEEPRDNTLRLLVEEAKALAEKTLSLPGIDLSGKEILSDESCRLFELRWSSYIAYFVRNESYTTVDQSEKVVAGHLLRLCSASKVLDFIRAATIASQDYPGPYHHVEVVCLNHVIDVVSTTYPEIRVLRPPEAVGAIQ